MNDGIILQQIYADSAYAEVLKITMPRHVDYARRHGLDYEFTMGNVVGDWDPKLGGWAKVACILSALQRNYKYVVWVDADSLIADTRVDLREGCPDGIGAVIHFAPNPHFNVGNLYMQNSEALRNFVIEWGAWYPGPDSWREQAVFNLLARTNPIVKELLPKWNSCRAGNTRVENPVVEGFHGEGPVLNRLKLMREWLETHE